VTGMQYLNTPNLPIAPVCTVLVDGRISSGIAENLTAMNIRMIRTMEHTSVYKAVSGHPDIMLHPLGGKRIVFAPGISPQLLGELTSLGFIMIPGESRLSFTYPANIAYNAARVGSFVFLNEHFTDPVLKRELDTAGVTFVNVKQGYAKCSLSIVDEKSIITADTGIARAAEGKGMDVLLVEPEKDICLPGVAYGFIGGSTVLLDKGVWAVTGCAGNLKAFHLVNEFLEVKGIKCLSLSDGPVTDLGSILPLMQQD
jgi:hypothetical protein